MCLFLLLLLNLLLLRCRLCPFPGMLSLAARLRGVAVQEAGLLLAWDDACALRLLGGATRAPMDAAPAASVHQAVVFADRAASGAREPFGQWDLAFAEHALRLRLHPRLVADAPCTFDCGACGSWVCGLAHSFARVALLLLLLKLLLLLLQKQQKSKRNAADKTARQQKSN